MQIRELNIDGFGIFHDTSIKGIQPGINVIFGPNEFGKTTFLEFIRKILFGFKKKTGDLNDYSPINGGKLGGKIVCALANNANITISRFAASQSGKANVTINSEFFSGQDKLESILGYASSDLYRNIFAFSLDELQEFSSLKVNDVKDRIYGAGLGLGSKSISQIEKYFSDNRDNLFKPKGKVQSIALLGNEIIELNLSISKIQENLTQYDNLRFKIKRLEEDIKDLLEQIQRLEHSKKRIENLLELFPVYVNWKSENKNLENLIDLPDLPQNSMEVLERLKAETQSIQNSIEEEKEEADRNEIESKAIFKNEGALTISNTFIALQNMTEQIRSTIQDISVVGASKDRLDDQIPLEIKKLGIYWNEPMVESFEITDTLYNQIYMHREALEEARIKVSRAKEKIESFRESKAKELSQGIQIPEWLKVTSYSLLSLGIMGLAWGGYTTNFDFLFFSLTILSISVVSLRMIFKTKKTLIKEDLQGPELVEQLDIVKSESDQKYASWKSWLKDQKFDEFLTPMVAEKTLSTLKEIKNMFNQRKEMDLRLNKMQETKEKALSLIQQVKPFMTEGNLGKDIITTIEILHRIYEQAIKNREKRTTIDHHLEGVKRKISRLEEQLALKKHEIQKFIGKANAKDEREFEEFFRLVEEKNRLKKSTQEKLDLMRSRIGLGDLFQKFLNSMETTSPEELKQKFDAISVKLDEVRSERDHGHKELGETENQIDQLATNKDLVELQNQKEVTLERLNKQSKNWAISQIALSILEQAKTNYEKERQPSVIQSAQKIF